jgi:hypothetical protein
MGQLSPFSRWSFSIGILILLLCGATAVLKQVSRGQIRQENPITPAQVQPVHDGSSDVKIPDAR